MIRAPAPPNIPVSITDEVPGLDVSVGDGVNETDEVETGIDVL
jgi:hypothetical protein